MVNVSIRRYQSGDADAIYDAVIESKTELSKWMPWCHPEYSRTDAIQWVESRPRAWENDTEWTYVIVDDNQNFLGTCGVHHIDHLNRVGEVGFWVRSSSTRQGIATEASRLICRWAFDDARLHRLEFLVSVENVASQHVARKVGAIEEAILRQRILLHGRRHDAILFAIVKDEFAARNQS